MTAGPRIYPPDNASGTPLDKRRFDKLESIGGVTPAFADADRVAITKLNGPGLEAEDFVTAQDRGFISLSDEGLELIQSYDRALQEAERPGAAAVHEKYTAMRISSSKKNESPGIESAFGRDSAALERDGFALRLHSECSIAWCHETGKYEGQFEIDLEEGLEFTLAFPERSSADGREVSVTVTNPNSQDHTISTKALPLLVRLTGAATEWEGETTLRLAIDPETRDGGELPGELPFDFQVWVRKAHAK